MVELLTPEETARLRPAPLTYPWVGATSVVQRLPGRRVWCRDVGLGRDTFRRAATAVLGWRAHSGAGLIVRASSPVAVVGEVVQLRLGWHRGPVIAECRVVRVVDDDRRAGFAYGTLPGHPERGEEAFLVEHRPDDRVVFSVVACAHPAGLLPTLGGPVTTWVQNRVVERYLQAIHRVAADGSSAR